MKKRSIWQKGMSVFFQPNNPFADITTLTYNTSGVGVNQDSALTIGAVYRSVQILSTAVCQMDLKTYNKKGEEIDNASLINRPNINMPTSSFVEQTVTSLALNGNAYWYMKRNAEGRVTNLEVLVPTSVIVKVSESGVYTYEYGDQRFTTRDIKHLSLMRVPGYVYGLGPIQKVRGELEQSLDLRTYTGSWFSSSGMATGVLKTDQSLTQEQADAYKERWGEVINGKDRTAILGNGLSYQSTYLNPKDALFIEAVNANLQQIARMFGIPASLLSLPLEGNSLTYSNVQDELNQFYKFTLTAYLNEIENALTDLIPRGQTVRFDPANLMRLSPQDRYANYKTAIDSGWLSPDEVRKMEGLKGPAPKKEPQPQPMGDVGAPDKGEAVNKEEENEDM